MLNPLFFLISRLNIACSPIIFNLQINYPIRIKDIPFESFQLWHFHFFLCNLQWQTIKDDLQIVLLLSCFVGHCICFAIKQIHCYTAVNLIVKLKFPIFKNMEERCSLDLRLRPAAFLPGRNQDQTIKRISFVLSDPPFKKGHTQYRMVPRKPLSDKLCGRDGRV